MVQSIQKKREGVSPTRRKPKIKYCDFNKVSRIQPELGQDRAGLCDFKKRIIYIDLAQPKEAEVTRGIVEHHERGHLFLADLGIKYTPKVTERFCDLYACRKAPLKSMTAIEKLLRENLFGWFGMICLAHARKPGKDLVRWVSQAKQMEAVWQK